MKLHRRGAVATGTHAELASGLFLRRQAAGVCIFGHTSSVCIPRVNGCFQCDDAILADLHAVLCRQGLFGMASQSPSAYIRSPPHQHMHYQWRHLKSRTLALHAHLLFPARPRCERVASILLGRQSTHRTSAQLLLGSLRQQQCRSRDDVYIAAGPAGLGTQHNSGNAAAHLRRGFGCSAESGARSPVKHEPKPRQSRERATGRINDAGRDDATRSRFACS